MSEPLHDGPVEPLRDGPLEPLRGYGVSRGVASGPVAQMATPPNLGALMDVADDDGHDDRAARAAEALRQVAADLGRRRSVADETAGAVLDAQILMASDPALTKLIDRAVAAGATAQRAIDTAFGTFREALAAGGAYMAERVADLDDVRDRAIARVLGLPMPGIPVRDEPFVLVAADLSPADTALLDPRNVIAIVTEQGGPSSHTAILAKAMAIPAVVAAAGACSLRDGETVLVDGRSGIVERDPDPAVITRAIDAYRSREALLDNTVGPGRLADGVGVKLMVNIGAERDLAAAAATDAEGVGLFRTEFLFLDRPSAPSVAEQAQTYRRVFDAFTGRRVVIRTLDAGADKPLAFVAHGDEPNPALGVRGYRTTRFAPDLLSDQLSAIAQAAQNCDTEVWVMAPMVSTPGEARAFAAQGREHGLRSLGSMIEVPGAALCARRVLAECDFVSIGTNDLAQYTFAADRMSGELGDLLDPWQPGLLELVRVVADAGARAGKPVGVCGEAASDPELALALVGLGVRSLSMAPHSVPEVRAALRAHSLADCVAIAEAAVQAGGAQEARDASSLVRSQR